MFFCQSLKMAKVLFFQWPSLTSISGDYSSLPSPCSFSSLFCCVPTVSAEHCTFEPVLVVVSALQLRFVLEVQQQVGQDFTLLISVLIARQQLFCRLDELTAV